MYKLVMKVSHAIESPQKNLWALIGVGVDIQAANVANIKAIKTAMLKKGKIKITLSIIELQFRKCFGDSFTLFLTTDTPLDIHAVQDAEVFAEFTEEF